MVSINLGIRLYGGGVYRAELFSHDAKADQMICPENKRLPFHYLDRQPGRTIRVYIARKEECRVCPLTAGLLRAK